MTICKGGKPLILGGSDGVVLPLVHIENQALSIILHLIGLLWCFMGVGIIADVFMCSIEKITSARKQVEVQVIEKGGERTALRTVKVWNDTVANLTLMALGSSAPEILLSLIELTLTEKMHSGALGPSTIVGSAAFNLLVITAVCVSAIPTGESRRIKDVSVFGVTAAFSIFAYLWLLFILVAPPSPDVVTVWEGVLTFLFFPLLVGIAYLADIGWFHKMAGKLKTTRRLVFSPTETTKAEYEQMIAILRKKYTKLPEELSKLEALLHYEFPTNTTRAARRIEAIRGLSAQEHAKKDDHLLLGADVARELDQNAVAPAKKWTSVHPSDASYGQAMFEHASESYAVAEVNKKVTLFVRRSGNLADKCSCRFKTVDGTAKAPQDYIKSEGKLEFLPNETEKTIEIEIIADKKHEHTEEFYVELIPIAGNGIVGLKKLATVVVLDSDSPGMLRFEKEVMDVPAVQNRTLVNICIQRAEGATGTLRCLWRTEDDSAKAGLDYEAGAGELVFENGVVKQDITVGFIPASAVDKKHEVFRVILEKHEEDAQKGVFDEGTDGGAECCILTVNIVADPDGDLAFHNCMSAAATRRFVNWDNVVIGKSNWKQQFVDAIHVNGGEEDEEATPMDYVLHAFSMPWKLLFAVVPPADFCGGWVCFFCALAMIGFCTAIIGDMANLLGCALDMKASICAVTFVALGTSLPDTFASKKAAVEDPTADNSIGNVTGSNSVNVFLGLGMPWAIGAIYWTIKGAKPHDSWYKRGEEMDWPAHVFEDFPDGGFVVPAGNLGVSVGVFCGCAITCVALLIGRRLLTPDKAELGGNKTIATISSCFLVMLWFIYIIMAVVAEGGLGPY